MMETFDLEIHLGGDVMQTPEDVARALRKVADRIESRGTTPGAVMDDNGNTCGHYGFEGGDL